MLTHPGCKEERHLDRIRVSTFSALTPAGIPTRNCSFFENTITDSNTGNFISLHYFIKQISFLSVSLILFPWTKRLRGHTKTLQRRVAASMWPIYEMVGTLGDSPTIIAFSILFAYYFMMMKKSYLRLEPVNSLAII
jgi:hypothetical protein